MKNNDDNKEVDDNEEVDDDEEEVTGDPIVAGLQKILNEMNKTSQEKLKRIRLEIFNSLYRDKQVFTKENFTWVEFDGDDGKYVRYFVLKNIDQDRIVRSNITGLALVCSVQEGKYGAFIINYDDLDSEASGLLIAMENAMNCVLNLLNNKLKEV